MVLKASAGSIRGATAAIFPPAMATSRTALIPFLGSMTWPPRSSRSYLGSAAAALVAAANRATAARRLIEGSAPSRDAPLRCPASAQVLAHVERARHRVAGDLAVEGVVERVAALLAV